MSEGLCTSCGAAVNLAAGQDEINCAFCGTLLIAKPSTGGAIKSAITVVVGMAF